MPPVYIVSAVRTPIGGFQQYVFNVLTCSCVYSPAHTARSLSSLNAIQLGSHVIKGTPEITHDAH